MRFLVACFFLSVLAAAQAPAPLPTAVRQVSACELAQNPKAYDRQLVSVHGRINLEFENFSVYDPACHQSPYDSHLWLALGGDVETPAAYCCGNHEREKGKDVQVKGEPIPLARTRKLDDFLRYLTASLPSRPDHEPCWGSQCNLYNVTATLKGKFFAIEKVNSLNGYGHMGCCHLLVIEEVTKLSAKRTRVPDAAAFQCSTDKWTPAPDEAAKLTSSECSSNPDCRFPQDIAKVAKHWGDRADTSKGTVDGGGHWVSPDLLLEYTTSEEEEGQLLISRQLCRPVAEKKP